MVRLIMGTNGAGKTKQLIELIQSSVAAEAGSVVCIEPSKDMTYDISYNVRLVKQANTMWILLSVCAASSAVCMQAITIFPICTWIICAR